MCCWGEGHELQPVAYGINKLIVSCVVLDDCLGTDDIEEAIMEMFGDDVQSVDVMAFNKASSIDIKDKTHPRKVANAANKK